MSNTEIANLYKAVIDEVISDSRQDFEDSAIDESTLQDLRAIWMEKLANTKVANFSWAAENDAEANAEADHIDQQQQVPSGNNNSNTITNNSNNSNNPNENSSNGTAGTNNVENTQPSAAQVKPEQFENDLSNSLSYPQTSQQQQSGVGLQFPTTSEQEGPGLVLPGSQRINQADGAQDFTFDVELPSTVAQDLLSQIQQQELKKKKKALLKNIRKQQRVINQADGANGDDDDDDDDDNDDYFEEQKVSTENAEPQYVDDGEFPTVQSEEMEAAADGVDQGSEDAKRSVENEDPETETGSRQVVDWPDFWCEKECRETYLLYEGCKRQGELIGESCVCSAHFRYKMDKCRADGCGHYYDRSPDWQKLMEKYEEECRDKGDDFVDY